MTPPVTRVPGIGLRTQWRSQPKNFWGAKMFDFRRITLFWLEKRLSKHKMTMFSKNLGVGMAPLPPLWLRLCSYPQVKFLSEALRTTIT